MVRHNLGICILHFQVYFAGYPTAQAERQPAKLVIDQKITPKPLQKSKKIRTFAP